MCAMEFDHWPSRDELPADAVRFDIAWPDPAVKPRDLAIGWEKECADTDALLTHLGLDPAVCRTEGGSLNLPRIKALMTEFHWQGEDANGNAVGLPVRFVRLATPEA